MLHGLSHTADALRVWFGFVFSIYGYRYGGGWMMNACVNENECGCVVSTSGDGDGGDDGALLLVVFYVFCDPPP